MSDAITPRGISYSEAARYLVISLSNFRKNVLPKLNPVVISPDRRIVTRGQLDRLLNGTSESAASKNSWDKHFS